MIRIPVEPQMTDYLHRKAARIGLPLSGTFELTPVCNMNCRMCYVRKSKEEQEAIAPLHSADEWLALGKEAKERGLVYLLLTGGEPFLRKDFRKILAGLHAMGLIISINSNGTLITEEVVEWLKKTPPIRINITLYGASDETYERLCGNPKGFTQVTKAIKLLMDAGICVKLNCSVTPYNAKDLEDIIQWAKAHDLVIQATSYMFPPLRKDHTRIGENDRFSAADTAYYMAKIDRLRSGDEEYLRRYDEEKLKSLGSEAEDDCFLNDPPIEGDMLQCRAGKCSYWITWDGMMLPCGMFDSAKALNVFERGFDASWESAKNEACMIRLPAGCKNCSMKDLCHTCAAMVYTETGNFHTVPMYRCEMARAYPDACRRVRDEILKERNQRFS